MEKINQKQLNRENLLNQGVGLLMQQGYHGTGLKEILDAVQVPKGSFYNYFGNKENFAAEIIEHYIVPYIAQLQSYLAQSEGNALAALERYLQESIVELERTEFKGGCLLGNLIGELADLWVNAWQGALLRMKVEQSVDPLNQCYHELLGNFFKA